MPNTLSFLSFPAQGNGVSVTSSATSWAFGSWATLVTRTNQDVYLMALRFQVTNVPSSDVTTEQLFEIGTGDIDGEITEAQVPYSFRQDTNIGYYLDTVNLFFPEVIYIPANTRIAVRAANSLASSITYNGVKVSYQSSVAIPTSPTVPNNYQGVGSVSAGIMSVGEKIR